MKTLVIKLSFIAFILFSYTAFNSALAQSQPDTALIDFGDSSKVVIYLQNAQDAKEMRKLDWNLIMERTASLVEEAHTDTESSESSPDRKGSDTEDEIITKDINGKTRSIIIGSGGIRIETEYDDEDDKKRKTFWRRTQFQMPLDFGLNNYFENGTFGNTPTGENYELRSWGSRYFAFGPTFKTQIGSKQSPFVIQYGLEASWNNFMFSGDNYALETNNGISFPDFDDNLEKSKLTVAYINVPFLVHLDFAQENKRGLKLAFGGYAGYRVGSYTKLVYRQDNEKQKFKERGNFYLNDWRYGARVELGIGEGKFRNGLRLFFNYDLNPLFSDTSNASELNAFSFGVRF